MSHITEKDFGVSVILWGQFWQVKLLDVRVFHLCCPPECALRIGRKSHNVFRQKQEGYAGKLCMTV